MYYAIRLGLATDGETKIQSITACDTLDEAKKKYHNDLFGYIGNCTRIACLVVDCGGNTLLTEYWEKEKTE